MLAASGSPIRRRALRARLPDARQDTPALSGGEAQRLKLSTELRKNQADSLFVLDEPTVGLHPLDVRTLLDVLERLIDRGATVVVVEHDPDLIANADHVIDMGPGGREAGGRIVAAGTPDQLAADRASITGRHLTRHLERHGHERPQPRSRTTSARSG